MRIARRFPSCRRALAAIEFALIAPVLVLMAFGSYDIVQGFITYTRVNYAAQAIGQIATSMAVAGTNLNQLNDTQALAATSAVYALLPALNSANPPAFSVVLSSIAMTPTVSGCTSNCTYTAHVAWSSVFQGSGTARPCDTTQGVSVITSVPDTASPSPTTLPVDAYSSSPLLVADVTYTFQPVFLIAIQTSITMTSSAYFSPRTGGPANWVQFTDTTPAIQCPGYPP
jgi:Flp pilus assembly protein TadG